MNNYPLTSAQHLEALHDNVSHFMHMTQETFFDLDFSDIEKIQWHHLQTRFQTLRPKIKVLDLLATDIGVDQIHIWKDVVPLCFPHTMYKSYRASDIDSRRYDRLTRWLATFTSHDLSAVDCSGCDSLDVWIERLESTSALRPIFSSGTSGKVSVFPRDVNDELMWFHSIIDFLSPYRGELSVDFQSGQVPILCPWPFDKGRHSLPVVLRLLREHLYGSREEMAITLRRDTMFIEEMVLMSKLKRAETDRKTLALSDAEISIVKALAQRRKETPNLMGAFAERACHEFNGRPIAFLTGWPQLYDFASNCKNIGIAPLWTAGSILWVAGGNKGVVLPDGWREVIEEVVPAGRFVFKEMYGMSEITGMAPLCASGHLHPFPWVIFQVVNPDSGELLPRSGVQTGRMMVFDLMPRCLWGGILSGDEMTIHWTGGCKCGRKGPFFDNHIQRYRDTRGGDDKITCAKSPEAYHNLENVSTSDWI